MKQVIESVWVFVGVDDDGEGVIAFMSGGQWFPMVAADEDRVNSLRPVAKRMAKITEKKVLLYRFDGPRTLVEEIS